MSIITSSILLKKLLFNELMQLLKVVNNVDKIKPPRENVNKNIKICIYTICIILYLVSSKIDKFFFGKLNKIYCKHSSVFFEIKTLQGVNYGL